MENLDYANKKERINSPRSLEALNLLGIEPQKLYYTTFKEFFENHPELKVLDKYLQEYRYQHHEEKRLNRIKMATEKRSELINNINNKVNFMISYYVFYSQPYRVKLILLKKTHLLIR